MTEFCCLSEKGHVWKESGVVTQGKREMEVGTSDNDNVIADKGLSYFLVFKFEVQSVHCTFQD